MTDTIAAEFQDQMVQIFASYGTTGYLYVVLDFAAPLDADVVRQATRRLLDAEPVHAGIGLELDDPAKRLDLLRSLVKITARPAGGREPGPASLS